MLRVALIIVLLGVYIASIIDVIRTPSLESRRLPVFVWLLIVILLPVLGGCIWWLLGRVWPDQGRKPVASPDDDPRFLRHLEDEAWKRRMRERRGDGQEGATEPAPEG